MRYRRATGSPPSIAAAFALALAWLLASCDDPTSPTASLDLSVSPVSLEVGAFLEASLTNRGSVTGYYDFCDAPLQLREGSEWITLRSVRLCLLRFTPLESGSTATAPMLMERAGTLRLLVPIKVSERAVPDTLVSREFVVTEP
jgi:hypothetical protein